jgi:hypothetical protein
MCQQQYLVACATNNSQTPSPGNVCMQVKTEHDILAQLAKQTLSFKVPAAKPTLKGSEPYVVLSNGAAACVFEIIPGGNLLCGNAATCIASVALTLQWQHFQRRLQVQNRMW